MKIANRTAQFLLISSLIMAHVKTEANQSGNPSLLIVNDASQIVSGGLNNKFDFRTLFIGSLLLKSDSNMEVYASLAGFIGSNGNESLGDLQGFSNIDAEDFVKIYEYWGKHTFRNDIGFIKVGQFDANSEFAYTANGGEFINSSMGYSPTIGPMVSYPDLSHAIAVQAKFNKDNAMKLGVFTDSENKLSNAFWIGEYTAELGWSSLKVGAWYNNNTTQKYLDVHTSLTSSPTTKFQDSDNGYYLTLDGTWERKSNSFNNLDWFVQIGTSDKKTQLIHKHIGAGVVQNNPFGLDGAALGLAFTAIKTSDNIEAQLPNTEFVIETFFKYSINNRIAIKPDIQYIKNPASEPGIDDALVVSLRTEFVF
jgi:porin